MGPVVIVYTRGKTGSQDASVSARGAEIAGGTRLPRGTAAPSFTNNPIHAMRRPSGEAFMTVLIIGGTGFIGRRLIPLLAHRGEESVVMDINPQTANFSELTKVKVLRGDVSQFDDVMAVMTAVSPTEWSTSPTTSPAICRRASRSSLISSVWTIASRRRGLPGATESYTPVPSRSAANRNSTVSASSMRTT